MRWFFNKNKMQDSNPSTQEFTGITTIKNRILVLEKGVFCLLIKALSKNIDLMTPEDQINFNVSFGRMLDGIDFPISIFIRPRQVDLKGYLDQIEKRYHDSNKESKRDFLRDYLLFFEEITEEFSIVDRSKWLVISWKSPNFQSQGYDWTKDYNQAKDILTERAKGIINFLNRMDVEGEIGSTEEIIRLFYHCYNYLHEEVQPWNPRKHNLGSYIVSGATR